MLSDLGAAAVCLGLRAKSDLIRGHWEGADAMHSNPQDPFVGIEDCHVRKDTLRVVSMRRTAIERAVRMLGDLLPSAYADLVRFEAATAAGEMDLPTPNIELDESESPVPAAGPAAGERPKRTTGGYAFVRLDGGEQ